MVGWRLPGIVRSFINQHYIAMNDDNDGNHDNTVNVDGDGDIDEDMEEEESDDMESDKAVVKKDMRLRSGKRKRRRSKETTGLTPPETIKKKKARKSIKNTEEATAAEFDSTKNGNKKTAPVTVTSPIKTNAVTATAALLTSDTTTTATLQGHINGAISLDVAAVGGNGESSPAMLPHARRISYSQKPAKIPQRISNVTAGENLNQEIPSDHQVDSVPENESDNHNQIDATIVAEKSTSVDTDLVDANANVNEFADTRKTTEEPTVEYNTFTRWSWLIQILCLLLVFIFSAWLVVPSIIKLTEYLIPLDDSLLPPPPKIPTRPFQSEEETEVEEEKFMKHEEIPHEEALNSDNDFVEQLKSLRDAEDKYTLSAQDLAGHYDDALSRYQDTKKTIQNRIEIAEGKLDELTELEELLDNGVENYDIEEHHQMRQIAQRIIGKSLIETDSVDLWGFPNNYDTNCNPEDLGIVKDEQETEPRLLTHILEDKEASLILRSTMTAEKFVGGAVAEDRVRKWVQLKIKKVIDDDNEATDALKKLSELAHKLSQSVHDVGETVGDSSRAHLVVTKIIQSRLDIDRADTTGIFDYASLKNGAAIVYRGKRGTSKSLIDYLPMFNRILQNANWGFYGFGPEAALTATYPPNTLGQCWSFQQTSLKEQLEERQLYLDDDSVSNDFQRGNFGTLTIKLPTPIYVESVVIEHPSVLFTGQAQSAIRSFRIVGYEDAMASSKAWNLGSFEYDLRKNKLYEYLQEFEVADTVFGKEIPRLHAISLAIDSNHGHEYACLYRFRVHGFKE